MNFYALIGIGLVMVGLGGYGAYQYQRAEAQQAKAEQAQARAAALTQSLAESEETNDALRVAARVLDQILVDRDRRGQAVEDDRRKTRKEFDELKKSLAKEDRACLDRDLPNSFLERLRNP